MYDLQWLFDVSSVNNILTPVELKKLRKQLYDRSLKSKHNLF